MVLDNDVKYMKMFFIGFQKSQFVFNILWRVGKIGSFGVCGGSGCGVRQTPNVPMWAGIKIFFKMCGGKNF